MVLRAGLSKWDGETDKKHNVYLDFDMRAFPIKLYSNLPFENNLETKAALSVVVLYKVPKFWELSNCNSIFYEKGCKDIKSS